MMKLLLILGLAAASTADAQTLRPWTDISAACRAAWNVGKPVELGPGVYYADETLLTPYGANHRLTGVGPGPPTTVPTQPGRVHPFARGCTYLVIRPRENADVRGLHFCGVGFELSGLTLIGPGKQTNSIGVLIAREGRRGLGTGKGLIENVRFAGFGTGIQFGLSEGDHNNDESDFRRLDFHECRVAVRNRNTFSMGHVFSGLRSGATVNRHFVVDGGGDLVVRDATVFGGTLLTFTANNARRNRPGPNNGQIRFENLKVDAGSGGRFVLFDAKGVNYSRVSVEGHVGGRFGASLGRVDRRMEVDISRFTGTGPLRALEVVDAD